MREVLTRRYRDAGRGDELYPDVILIDGGKGQLSAAMGIFRELDVQPPRVISLAKKEELIHATWLDEPVKLGRNNPGLKLCMAIRDEAHRFAQHYHHILRRKKTLGIDGHGGEGEEDARARRAEARGTGVLPGRLNEAPSMAFHASASLRGHQPLAQGRRQARRRGLRRGCTAAQPGQPSDCGPPQRSKRCTLQCPEMDAR